MITVSKVFQSVPPLFAHLSKVISGDIDCSHLALKEHSNDTSPYAVFPQAVLYPKTTSDIKHAIAFAREYQLPLTVCGGRTAGSGGALGEGVIIDMTRYFSKIRHVNMMEHTVTVDAGVRIDDLREKLSMWNMEIPVLQGEYSDATLGGLVATKSATASTFFSGTIREWIEGMTVVVDTGEEHRIEDGITPSGRLLGIYQAVFPLLGEHGPTLRAAKREQSDDATGYSLWNTSIGPRQLLDQLTGSEGTLAIITSITLRVVPKKRHTTTVIVPIKKHTLLETYTAIAKHHGAEQLFMFDKTFRSLVERFHSGLIDENIPTSDYTLLVSFRHDDAHELQTKVKTFTKALPEQEEILVEVPRDTATKLMSRAFLHALFKDYSKGTYTIATGGEGIIVHKEDYSECLDSIDQLLSSSGRLYTLTGYIGSGHIAATVGFDMNKTTYEEDLARYREELFALVKRWRGGISAVGGDGLERTAALSFVFNEATRDVFKLLKGAWDPFGIFNPSKKTHITKDYLFKHTARSLS